MTNVSKNLLQPTTEKKLFNQLANLFVIADDKLANKFVYELFTPSERIMFMKRLAAIILVHKGISSYRIAKTLKMSKTTISDLADKLESGSFDSIIGVTKKKGFDSEQFWETVDVLLRAGMPSMGKNRWDWLK